MFIGLLQAYILNPKDHVEYLLCPYYIKKITKYSYIYTRFVSNPDRIDDNLSVWFLVRLVTGIRFMCDEDLALESTRTLKHLVSITPVSSYLIRE